MHSVICKYAILIIQNVRRNSREVQRGFSSVRQTIRKPAKFYFLKSYQHIVKGRCEAMWV